jgi:hypothetical protein
MGSKLDVNSPNICIENLTRWEEQSFRVKYLLNYAHRLLHNVQTRPLCNTVWLRDSRICIGTAES